MSKRIGRPRRGGSSVGSCHKTGKRRFLSEIEAKLEATRITGRADENDKPFFFCRDCHSWHLAGKLGRKTGGDTLAYES